MVKRAIFLALLLAAAPLTAQAQLAPPRGASEQFGEQLAGTQQYMQSRWMALYIPLLLKTSSGQGMAAGMQAEARRLGTRGPTAQDWAALNAELTRQIDAYLNSMEAIVRSGQAKWPQDRSRTSYDNAALIMIEGIRADAKAAIAKRSDVLPVMMRTSKLYTWLVGGQQFFNYFIGREEAIEDALRAVKMAAPRPAGR